MFCIAFKIMRALLQRVSEASVEVDQKIVGKVGTGLLILLGVTHIDSEKEVDWLINKLIHLRIFTDENDKMNKSLIEIRASLFVSQFTLYGDAKEGRWPSFRSAASLNTLRLCINCLKLSLWKKNSKLKEASLEQK